MIHKDDRRTEGSLIAKQKDIEIKKYGEVCEKANYREDSTILKSGDGNLLHTGSSVYRLQLAP